MAIEPDTDCSDLVNETEIYKRRCLSACGATDKARRLLHAVEHAARLLPAQGPIEVFVHHNTLHAFEEFSFHQAVARAADLYGCQPYLSEDRYLEELTRGRILTDDLSAVLLEKLGDDAFRLIGLLGTRFHLRLAMLQHRLRIGTDSELNWILAETETLRTFGSESPPATRQQMIDETRHRILRDFRNGRRGGDDPIQAIVDRLFTHFEKRNVDRWNAATWETFTLHLLWQVCQHGVGLAQRVCNASSPVNTRPQGRPFADAGRDVDRLVNDVLIRFCAAFLDQGFSHWRLPNRDAGFYRSFLELYRTSRPTDRRLRGLPAELNRLENGGIGPLKSLEESLRLLGVSDAERDEFLLRQLLTLPGWAGMIWQMETNAEWADRPAPEGTLVEYLAIRLIVERVAKRGRQDGSSTGQPPVVPHPVSVAERAFLVFQLAQIRGWSPFDLHRLSVPQWSMLVNDVDAFSDVERRRVYHQAYERRYRQQVLDAILNHQGRTEDHRGRTEDHGDPAEAPPRPSRFQVICCIDEREESFRRHLEEIAPDCETFGAAGFFGVAMYYRGVGDAHFVPLCPNVIKPRHAVREEVVYSLEDSHRSNTARRRKLGRISHRLHVGSRTALGGALAGVFGSLATFPLVAPVLFPRLTAGLRRHAGRFVQPPAVTRLRLERQDDGAALEAGGLSGYTVDEMAVIVENLLRDIGLTRRFAPLVVVTGHGSASLNNPHEAAHDCGACGGGRGGPNARAFAEMANDPRVRTRMEDRGLSIPKDTVFIGAYHNTCDEAVTWYDLDQLPVSHRREFERLKEVVERARRRNAHERCRRFESAPLTLSADEALWHVEGRAEDLSQTRPEYGHATNAVCFVGRRRRTRGLFLDRRTFLTSYDPTQDDEERTILSRILQAVIPVCAGINLEYYFSYVDATGYGCGTKLPHNITSLLGVMDGAQSDLRPGLPWQMVEIHEPVRILFVIETTPQAMLAILDRNETIGRLVRNEWVQLAVLDSDVSTNLSSPTGRSGRTAGDGVIHLFHKGRFQPYHPDRTELPVVGSSLEWYRGWREHLGFASVRAATCAAETVAVPVGGAERKAGR